MATLQNIRNRGVLLAVVIGLALLAFIIGDFLNSGSTLFHQSRQNVADINGEKINIQVFQEAIEQLNTVYKIESGRTDFKENEMAQLRTQVWESLVNEKILEAEAKKMGLTVSREELREKLIGNNIHSMIMQRPTFVDPQTGQFSRTNLLQFYNSVFDDNVPPDAREQLREAKTYWLFWENAVKNAILQDKYFNLIGNAVSANSVDAKYNFEARKATGDVNYVVQSYFSVPDSTIQITNAEYKSSYDAKKEQFKQEASRSIKYVSFDVEPLEEDFKEAQAWMDRVSEEFLTTNDVAGLISSESDITYDEKQTYSRQTVPANLKDFAFSNNAGAFYGPVFQNNTHSMAKILESGIMESDSVKLSHIALEPTNEKKADSLINVLKGGADFAEAARKNSLAQQTAQAGGDVGWITRAMVGKEISGPAFSKGLNEIFKVSNANGIQIFKITEKTPLRQKVRLAILERKVTPSNQSYSQLFNEAKQFAAGASDLNKFEDLAKEKGYVVRPAMTLLKNSDNVDMIPQSRQIVRWAFENSKGTVSDVFDCDRNTYVVAIVSDVAEKGYRSLEQVKPQLRSEILKNKKSEILKKQIAEQLAKTPTLDGLATALNTEVKTAAGINFASYQFGDGGMEPYVIGRSSVTPEGTISGPMRGQTGVYVISPLAKVEDATPFDAKMEIMQLNYRTSQSLPYMIMQKMRDRYKIVDNRSNFY